MKDERCIKITYMKSQKFGKTIGDGRINYRGVGFFISL